MFVRSQYILVHPWVANLGLTDTSCAHQEICGRSKSRDRYAQRGRGPKSFAYMSLSGRTLGDLGEQLQTVL
jgi:hypothetical protein